MPSLPLLLLLAVVQGACELLPVSSSAHVILVEHWLGLDPTTAPMTLLLVMLHTGTMAAVMVYFWESWSVRLRQPGNARYRFLWHVAVATVATLAVGGAALLALGLWLGDGPEAPPVESLFGNLPLMAASLAAGGALILLAGRHRHGPRLPLTSPRAIRIGLVQGLCLPFRGFSRSGATISVGLLTGLKHGTAEEFSFALAVVLTPPVLIREALRFWAERDDLLEGELGATVGLCLLGAVLSFTVGLFALGLLSRWLDKGRWSWFGVYCLGLSAVTLATAWHRG